MPSELPTPDPADDELRRLWQAAPEPEAPRPAPAVRQQLAARRRRLLLRQAGTLVALLLAPVALLWVMLTFPLPALALVGLLLATVAVLGALARQLYAVRLFYTYPAQEAPAAYVARLSGYYQWQLRHGLRFYQAYVVLLNAGLALFFAAIYPTEPAWQWGLPAALLLLTVVMLRRYSQGYARREQQQTQELLRGLQSWE